MLEQYDKASGHIVASGELLLAFRDQVSEPGDFDKDPKLAMEQLDKTCKAFAEASTCIPAVAMAGIDESLLKSVVESMGKFMTSKPLDEVLAESARALLKSAKLAFPTSAQVVGASKKLDDIIASASIDSKLAAFVAKLESARRMGIELFNSRSDDGAKANTEIRQAVVELGGVKLSYEVRDSIERFVHEAFGLAHGKLFNAESVHIAQVIELLIDFVDDESFAVYKGLIVHFNLQSPAT